MLVFRRRRQRARATVRAAVGSGVTALDQRLPVAEAARGLLRKAFPDHWSFLLGELALYSFVLLLLTGSWLTMFFDSGSREILYQGSYAPLDGVPVSEAYDSTLHISFDVRGGLLVRQMHHWAALVFVAAVMVHLARNFFTGAFRKPREINWVIGVVLLLLALLEGFCGYSLPDDLLSGTGLRTARHHRAVDPAVGHLPGVPAVGRAPSPGYVLNQSAVAAARAPSCLALLIALLTVHLFLWWCTFKHTQWSWAWDGPTATRWGSLATFPQSPSRRPRGLFLLGLRGLCGCLGGGRADQPGVDVRPLPRRPGQHQRAA